MKNRKLSDPEVYCIEQEKQTVWAKLKHICFIFGIQFLKNCKFEIANS